MTCPSSVMMPSCSTAIVMRYPAWWLAPWAPLHARAEPRVSTVFAATVFSAIEPHRSAAPKIFPRPGASGAPGSDRKGVDTSTFVLIVDDDPDLLDVTS